MCCIRASLVCNAMCVHIPAFCYLTLTWCFPELRPVTCASSLNPGEGRGEGGSQSEGLSSYCWCSLLTPPKWQQLLGHLRTALQGVLLLARRLCTLERWKRWLQNYCCYCPHHRRSHLGNYQIPLIEGDRFSYLQTSKMSLMSSPKGLAVLMLFNMIASRTVYSHIFRCSNVKIFTHYL